MTQNKTPLVELRDISIAFGGIKAVDHVSIDLHPGEVVGTSGGYLRGDRLRLGGREWQWRRRAQQCQRGYHQRISPHSVRAFWV